jgi:hypothetical protein
MHLDTLTDNEREALEAFLALPNASALIQGALVASKIGETTTYAHQDRTTFALVAYGQNAHIWKVACDGLKQAIGLARS